MDCRICNNNISLSEPVERITITANIELPPKLCFMQWAIESMIGEEIIVHKKCLEDWP